MSIRALPAWIVVALLPLTALAAPAADAKRKRVKPRARTAVIDRTAPRVAFVAPTAGATVSGTLDDSTCRVSARDNVRVRKVVFAVDGTVHNTEVEELVVKSSVLELRVGELIEARRAAENARDMLAARLGREQPSRTQRP